MTGGRWGWLSDLSQFVHPDLENVDPISPRLSLVVYGRYPFGAAHRSVTDIGFFFEREFGLHKLDVKLQELETLKIFFRPYLLRHNGRRRICRYERDRTVEGSRISLLYIYEESPARA